MSSIDDLNICSGCGNTPCKGYRLIKIGRDFKASTDNDNKAVRYNMHKKYTYETFGILGRAQRVSLPRYDVTKTQFISC